MAKRQAKSSETFRQVLLDALATDFGGKPFTIYDVSAALARRKVVCNEATVQVTLGRLRRESVVETVQSRSGRRAGVYRLCQKAESRTSMTADEFAGVLEQSGASQMDLAEWLWVDVRTVQKWLHGEREIKGPAAKWMFLLRDSGMTLTEFIMMEDLILRRGKKDGKR